MQNLRDDSPICLTDVQLAVAEGLIEFPSLFANLMKEWAINTDLATLKSAEDKKFITNIQNAV